MHWNHLNAINFFFEGTLKPLGHAANFWKWLFVFVAVLSHTFNFIVYSPNDVHFFFHAKMIDASKNRTLLVLLSNELWTYCFS